MRKISVNALGIAAILLAAPAFAHHSGAMYDGAKTVELSGTVKEFQWTNPHTWLQVVVADDKGASTEWSLELGSLNTLAHAGWKPTTLKAGDKVKFAAHPMRDGSKSGLLMSVTLPDGKIMEINGGAGAAVTAEAVAGGATN